jgi:Ca2+/H+ antiporter
VLLLEFASYIWFFYHTHVDEDKIPNAKLALAALGLLAASLSTRVANENQSLKELRAAAREASLKNEQKEPYSIYTIISILIFSIIALVFASIYLVEAVHAPSKELKLFKSFIGLVVIPSVLAIVDHVAAVIRS